MQEREKNRAAMKSLVRCCTHFLIRHHISHSINFTPLVDLVMSCWTTELQVFVENTDFILIARLSSYIYNSISGGDLRRN